jgi:hypothetical protein
VSYIVIKTIKGRRYAYEQRTWREGRKVHSESRYLGPADGSVRAASPRSRRRGIAAKFAELIAANTLNDEERGALAAERFAERVDAYQRERFGETAAERGERERQAFLDGLHERYGLSIGPRNPMPVEKAAAADRTGQAAAPAGNAASTSQTADGPAADATGPE